MGRAIVRQPEAFLMDEPLSNLDAKLRVQMRAEIARLQNDLGTTTIYVTHDQVEAMTMGDRVAVMRKGELQQVDSPQELYDQPLNLFVGGFIGSPAMNMLEAKLERANGGLDRGRRRSERGARRRDALRSPGAQELRGQDRDPRNPPRGPRRRRARKRHAAGPAPERRGRLREALGAEVMVHFRVNAKPALTEDIKELARDVGEEAESGEEATMVGRFGPRTRIREGDTAEVAVDTRALHFFDPETGAGIYGHDRREE